MATTTTNFGYPEADPKTPCPTCGRAIGEHTVKEAFACSGKQHDPRDEPGLHGSDEPEI